MGSGFFVVRFSFTFSPDNIFTGESCKYLRIYEQRCS